ncbi:MAG: CAP domain-containing protein, partial [Eubacterium sp.]|nr:CAP domain-containing protein [Eubacterium sp.]
VPVILTVCIAAVIVSGVLLGDRVVPASSAEGALAELAEGTAAELAEGTVVELEEIESPLAGYIDKTYTVSLPGGKTAEVTGHYDGSMENQIISQVNAYRKIKGVAPLGTKDTLNAVADTRAIEISYKFSHYRPDGTFRSSVGSAIVNENLAGGADTAADVVDMWMKSAVNNANLIRTSHKFMGVSVFCRQMKTKTGRPYYVYYTAQVFSG